MSVSLDTFNEIRDRLIEVGLESATEQMTEDGMLTECSGVWLRVESWVARDSGGGNHVEAENHELVKKSKDLTSPGPVRDRE